MSSAIDVTSATWAAEVVSSDLPVVVDFWAPWCGPCRMVGPEIDKLAVQYAGKVKFVKVNVDESPDIASKFDVLSIPTIIKVVGGERVAQVVGARGGAALAKDLAL